MPSTFNSCNFKGINFSKPITLVWYFISKNNFKNIINITNYE